MKHHYKFKNDLYNSTLEFIVYNYKDKKDVKKITKYIVTKGLKKIDAVFAIENYQAFCHFNNGNGLIVIDYSVCRKNKALFLELIQHECGHYRQGVLESISENIEETDRESHLRISDWAFRKCITCEFSKKFINIK